ncbi:glycosyltransferase family 4 protein [Acinetobacter dispersus]|uniref:glycosyltransferase family 4 protein n=1 Tax=Acinetobacter dispersus TaxID=70348 RepID=UPI001F4BC238|nr:glycosyltransferase family 4 protein [Acinetobacter dispersus]MCH7385315.1 glycosyltransferase family 4 protein [Acinetobacter dispersus]
MKIAHLTSAHPRFDIRIYWKECLSLSKIYETYLVVADGLGNEIKNNINIVDVGKPKSRNDRLLNASNNVLIAALEIDADIYHLHDPELLSIALKLKKRGYKVVFDAHEDLPKQILAKPYLNKFSARIISLLAKYYERYICSKIDYIVAATPAIRDKFLSFSNNVVDINNYPLLGELTPLSKDWNNIKNEVVYVGGISKIRGVEEVVDSLSLLSTSTRLNLVGTFGEKITYESVKKNVGWLAVNELGQLNREDVKEILQRSVAGLVTFLPVPNHIDAQPNKMFEYMSAGIPVIGSNYPLWKTIIEDNNCGLCVDPTKPDEIASAIDKLIADKNLAEEMGKNGIKAVNEKYNWTIEESKLIGLYNVLLGS